MRQLFAVTAALLALQARAADPGAEAADSYRIDAVAAPAELAVGKAGVLKLAIVPGAKVHVHPQAPLKVTLSSTGGLTPAKAQLGRADAVDPKSEGPRFEVTLAAIAAGRQEVRARLDFFICSDQWCVKQIRDVAVPVVVR